MKKIVILGTGGTIAGTAADPSDNVGYTAAQVGVADLLASIPGLSQALRGQSLLTEQVAQIDSKDMSFVVWQQLALRVRHYLAQADVAGIIITHGTDTLEETAYFLSAVLPPASLALKPVVFTCAMRPASSAAPDGPQNVLDAVSVVNTPGACGVTVVCAATVHDALHVQKIHPYRLDAFSSGEAGPVAFVEEGCVRLVRNWPLARASQALEAIKNIAFEPPWPRVEILMNYAGASGAMVDALVLAGQSDLQPPLRGLVVAATGNGTVHQDLEAALHRAVAAGIHVMIATRCAMGRVIPGAAQAFADSQGLSPVKARVALMLDLLS